MMIRIRRERRIEEGAPVRIQQIARIVLQSNEHGVAGEEDAGAEIAPDSRRRRREERAIHVRKELRADIHKSARGDKDAAARVARRYRDGGAQQGRYEGWLQYAAGLGNGIAAYELALHYRRSAQPLLGSQFESLARELGYTPPPTLDHYRK